MKILEKLLKKKKKTTMPEKIFEGEAIRAVDIIAPASIEIKQNYLPFNMILKQQELFLRLLGLGLLIGIPGPLQVNLQKK